MIATPVRSLWRTLRRGPGRHKPGAAAPPNRPRLFDQAVADPVDQAVADPVVEPVDVGEDGGDEAVADAAGGFPAPTAPTVVPDESGTEVADPAVPDVGLPPGVTALVVGPAPPDGAGPHVSESEEGPPAPATGLETDAPAYPGRLPMDPRIRERRVAVQRRAGRRRLYVLLGLVAVLFLVAMADAVAHSPLLDVRHVRVRGANHTDPALIALAAGLRGNRSMIDVNAAAMAARIDRLPWVATARVRREWPSTVRIEITERTAWAVVAEAVPAAPPAPRSGLRPAAPAPTRWGLVDSTGRVLAVAASPPPGLVRLIGVGPAGAPGSQLDSVAGPALAVVAALPDDLRSRLTTAGPAVASPTEIDLAMTGAGVVRWGPPDQAGDKVLALRTVLARVDLTDVATVDVRVPLAPVLTRQAHSK
jgi:cell division protein FtsQ